MCQFVHSKSESYGHVPANNACKFGRHLKYKRIVSNVAIESLVALVGRLLLCLHRCKGDGITMNLWFFLQHTFPKFHETRLWTCVDVRYYLFLLVSLLPFPSCRPLPCCQQNYGCRIGLSGRVFVWNCGFRFSVWVLVSSLIYFPPIRTDPIWQSCFQWVEETSFLVVVCWVWRFRQMICQMLRFM